MKYPRKLAGILLALVMVFSMTVTAFAAEVSSTGQTGTITVENPVAGKTYTAYKIFDVTYNGSTYAYAIPANSEWYATVATFATVENGLTLTKAADESNGIIYVVTIEDGKFRAAAFAAALKAAVKDKTGTALSGDKPTAANLELGYYFVTSTSGALCNLTTTDPTANIYDKNDVPFEKTDDQSDVEVGQPVNYTITGKVPDTTGFESYTYQIKDTMTDGLTFNKDVKVVVGETELAKEYYTLTNSDNGFTLDIDVKNLQEQVMKVITVTYSATVNKNAIAQVETNSATLEYSNDPTSDETYTTVPDKESVYSAEIVINKVNEKDEKLADAKFVLYKEVVDGESTAKHYYIYNEESDKVEWISLTDAQLKAAIESGTVTQVVTDSEGSASFGGLCNGTYYLLETDAPDGYNLLDKPVTVTINNNDTAQTLSVTTEVENKTGSILPETGGMGTQLFYGFGCILVLAAAVLLITRKRISYMD